MTIAELAARICERIRTHLKAALDEELSPAQRACRVTVTEATLSYYCGTIATLAARIQVAEARIEALETELAVSQAKAAPWTN